VRKQGGLVYIAPLGPLSGRRRGTCGSAADKKKDNVRMVAETAPDRRTDLRDDESAPCQKGVNRAQSSVRKCRRISAGGKACRSRAFQEEFRTFKPARTVAAQRATCQLPARTGEVPTGWSYTSCMLFGLTEVALPLLMQLLIRNRESSGLLRGSLAFQTSAGPHPSQV
jgi:hypothetical protein